MPERLFVTLGSRRRKDRILLEMPSAQPIHDWIQDLVQVVGWKELADVPRNAFFLETEEGERLPEDRTLKDAGITSSDLLFLSHEESQSADQKPVSKKDASGGEPSAETPERAAESAKVQEILGQPHLEGPRGLIFVLHPLPVTIGRSGKGVMPDIDLSEWDPKMIISRRHAVIEKTKGGIALRPEKTTNGTFVNGVEAPAGEARILQDGDRIHFGFKGLELIYREGKAD
jgi:hypothetical protein